MNAMDNEYSQNMNGLTSNMEKLSSSTADGFAMLRQMMIQPYDMPPAQPGQTYQSYSMNPHPASSVGRQILDIFHTRNLPFQMTFSRALTFIARKDFLDSFVPVYDSSHEINMKR